MSLNLISLYFQTYTTNDHNSWSNTLSNIANLFKLSDDVWDDDEDEVWDSLDDEDEDEDEAWDSLDSDDDDWDEADDWNDTDDWNDEDA